MKFMPLLVLFIFSINTFASIPKVLFKKGSVIGGVSGLGYTLLDLKYSESKNKKIERVVFEIGDIKGLPNKGLPGFYHVELKDKPNQLVIDFSQMPNSRLSELELKNKLKKSKFVSNTQMILDPVSMGLNLAINLKKNVKVKVYQVAGNKHTSKVVIDLIQ